MQKKYFRTGILLIVLGIPVFVFLFLKFFGSNKFDLPYYFPELDESGEVRILKGDTVFTKAPEFELLSQDSLPYLFKTKSDELKVISFFFSRCGTVCPITNKNLLRVAQNFKNNRSIKLVSITVDPKYDTPEILKQYSYKIEADKLNWVFLTGEKRKIYDIAINKFKLPVSDASEYDKNIIDIDQTFIHSDKLLLVDKDGFFRGIYEGTNPADVDRLMVEIKVLLK